MDYKLALIGFGVVGQGLLEILVERRDELEKTYGATFTPVAISDTVKGSVYDPDGLDAAAILSYIQENGKLEGYPCPEPGWDAIRTASESNADILVEVSFTDIQTGEPASGHIRAALESGKHAVTTNKGPVVVMHDELAELARSHGVEFKFEGTVLSGTPVLNLARFCLKGTNVLGIRGILNGTTNFILCEMETGMTYEEALAEAQSLGYAEAQPDADVLGHDALAKIMILARTVMGVSLDRADVQAGGITELSLDEVKAAAAEGRRYKLIARVERTETGVSAGVALEKLPVTDPLATVTGPTNALTFVTDLLGETTIVGAGAGKKPTGYALLTDLLEIHETGVQ